MKTSIRCPSCSGPLTPVELHCDACDIAVRGRFTANEFCSLGEEDLHFLRIFVLCEGRIRDMESALGVSYPTIKARLAKLKETLAAQAAGAAEKVTPAQIPAAAPIAPTQESRAAQVLRDLAQGRVEYDAALEKLRQIAKENIT